MSVKIFGREPAAVVGVLEALFAVALSFNALHLTSESVALWMAAVTAALGVYTAYVTRDTMLGVAVGFAKAALALAVGYGLSLSADQTSALLATVTVVFGFFQRTQTSPVANPSFATVTP